MFKTLLRFCVALVTIGFGIADPIFCQDSNSKNDTLLDAMSPFEGMAGAALSNDTKSVKESLVEEESGAAEVLKALPPSALEKHKQLLKAIQDAAKATDRYSVAVNAVEMFRLLADSLDGSKLEVPKKVSLLDYVGFRLHVLAAAKAPDWDAMKLTVVVGRTWQHFRSRIADRVGRCS